MSIDENSSELDIVKHALGLAIDLASPAVQDYCDEPEDLAAWAFIKRVHSAAEAGDLTQIRLEIAEADEPTVNV